MVLYTLTAIGAGIILALGVPLMQRLLGRIKPLTPKQEEGERFLEQAHRSIDRIPR